jgi:hypothetical protein
MEEATADLRSSVLNSATLLLLDVFIAKPPRKPNNKVPPTAPEYFKKLLREMPAAGLSYLD